MADKTRARQRPVRPEIRTTKFIRHVVIAAPAPAPAVAPRPCGVLDDAAAVEIREAAKAVWSRPLARCSSRDQGLRHLLQHMGEFPGHSWQQRWESSGLNGRGCPVRDLAATSDQGTELTQALEALISMRIIAPTLEAFRANQFRDYPERFRIAQADPQLDAFFAAVAAAETSPHFRRRALFDVCTTLTPRGSPSPTSRRRRSCTTPAPHATPGWRPTPTPTTSGIWPGGPARVRAFPAVGAAHAARGPATATTEHRRTRRPIPGCQPTGSAAADRLPGTAKL